MTIRRFPNATAFLLVILLILVISAAGQSGSVDMGFSPLPINPPAGDINFQQITQPDGKVIIYGAPSLTINGQVRSGMFRLNADGSIDPTFNFTNSGGVSIGNVALAPDGKIILAGSTSPNHARMSRLNADGSLDPTFSVQVNSSTSPEFGHSSFFVNAVMPDGKVIATVTAMGFVPGNGTWGSFSMNRYTATGSPDAGFTAPSLPGGHLYSTSTIVRLLPDGRYYLGVSSGNHISRSISVTRRNTDGSVDATFPEFTRTVGTLFIALQDMSVANDGGVFITGTVWPASIGFPLPQQLLKLQPTGGVDAGFNSPTTQVGNAVHALPDGKVLYSAAGGAIPRNLVRLNSDGSLDNTYALDATISSLANKMAVDQLNRPVFLASAAGGRKLVRLLDNGSIDPSFDVVIGSAGNTSLLAPHLDGKVLVYGNFLWMNGIARNGLARLNVDGSVDTSFDPGGGFNAAPREILVQPDGKTLAVGSFSTYNGLPAQQLVRINVDGSIDNTFSVTFSGSTAIEAVALQPDGKILVGSNFTSVNGTNRTGLARVDSTGALDMSFNPVISSVSIREILVESSGKIVIGGQFTDVNGVGRNNLARLESSGATDESFNANGVAIVTGLWRQADGRYVIMHGSTPQVARRNSDGSPDSGFAPPLILYNGSGGWVEDVLPLPDGGMLVGGEFNSVQGFSIGYIVRLRRNGTVDQFFLQDAANARVTSIVSTETGKATVAGIFNSIAGVTRYGIARLNVPAVQVKTPFDFDGDGRADVSVYRPSSGVWYQLFSSGIPYGSPSFGMAGDIPVPADYDGDGKTDLAIFRPSNGDWWYRATSDISLRNVHFGATGDIPLSADINNDGTSDFIVFRPANNRWYRMSTTGVVDEKEFGLAGDKPVVGDFDGDGKADQAIFRPSTGDWWYSASSAGGAFRASHWGQDGDIPAPADYDGDGKTDFAVFRPSNGGWYVSKSSDGSYTIVGWGVSGDRPVAADYDGDGRADIAVFRPSTGVWYLNQTTSGSAGVQWGISSDVAIPNAFVQP